MISVILAVGMMIVFIYAGVKTNTNKTTRNQAAERKPDIDSSATLFSALKQQKEEHSHDRLSGYDENEHSDADHWKAQLDSFLKAGLVTKQEYAQMLEHRNNINI